MRYLVSLVCALAFVFAPVGVSAQAGEDVLSGEPTAPASMPEHLQRRIPGHQYKHRAGEPPAQFSLEYKAAEELGPQELRVRRRSGIGFGVSLAAFVGGLAMLGYAMSNATVICIFECPPPPDWVAPVGFTGGFLMIGGLAGVIASAVTLRRGQKEPRSLEPTSPDDLTGAKLRQRHRELRNLREAHYGQPRRVQWDLAQSRIVF